MNSERQKKINVVVLSGNNYGLKPAYREAAFVLGNLLAEKGFRLVNGGGDGLMSETAKGAKTKGGTVEAIGLEGFVPNEYIDHYQECKTIRERQRHLLSLGDAYISLPGGSGTLYETFEIYLLMKLKEIEVRPFILLNIAQYYEKFVELFEYMRNERFITEDYTSYFKFAQTPKQAIDMIMEQLHISSKKG